MDMQRQVRRGAGSARPSKLARRQVLTRSVDAASEAAVSTDTAASHVKRDHARRGSVLGAGGHAQRPRQARPVCQGRQWPSISGDTRVMETMPLGHTRSTGTLGLPSPAPLTASSAVREWRAVTAHVHVRPPPARCAGPSWSLGPSDANSVPAQRLRAGSQPLPTSANRLPRHCARAAADHTASRALPTHPAARAGSRARLQ